MSFLPGLDLHAHIDPTIAPHELKSLDAVVFAATRSLEESDLALRRDDARTIWGVGCHPGLAGAQKAFSASEFRSQLERTAFVGEVGLDGKSRVPIAKQEETLTKVLTALTDHPRIVSLHSYAATSEVLQLAERWRSPGMVLHWWLGSPKDTIRAIEIGAYFSINTASIRRPEILELIPLERLLPETDHPHGDRKRSGISRPGYIGDVESAVAKIHGLTDDAVRLQLWKNFAALVSEAGVGSLLPREVRVIIASL